MPYRQLHIARSSNHTEVLPAAPPRPAAPRPVTPARSITPSRPAPAPLPEIQPPAVTLNARLMRVPTVVTIVVAAVAAGLAIGAALTVAAMTRNASSTRAPVQTSQAQADAPPLPDIPVRGVSSGRRLHNYPVPPGQNARR